MSAPVALVDAANDKRRLDIDFGDDLKEGGMCAASDGTVFIGRGGAVMQLGRDLNLSVYAGKPSVSSYADGHRLNEATFCAPGGMVEYLGGLIVCDRQDHRIRFIEYNDVSTFAGTGTKGIQDGPKEQSLWSWPNDVVLFRNSLFIADYGNNRVRVIDAHGMVSSIGNGTEVSKDGAYDAEEASFRCPFGIALMMDHLYVTDQLGHCLREIDVNTKQVRTMGGSRDRHGFVDGALADAKFHHPKGLASCPDGSIVLCDYWSHRICRISLDTNSVETILVTEHEDVRKEGPPDILTSVPLRTPKQPYFICASEDGHLYWTCNSSKQLHILFDAVQPYSLPRKKGALFSSQALLPDLLHDPLSGLLSPSPLQQAKFEAYQLRLPESLKTAHRFTRTLLNLIHPALSKPELWAHIADVAPHYASIEYLENLIAWFCNEGVLNNTETDVIEAGFFIVDILGTLYLASLDESDALLMWAWTMFANMLRKAPKMMTRAHWKALVSRAAKLHKIQPAVLQAVLCYQQTSSSACQVIAASSSSSSSPNKHPQCSSAESLDTDTLRAWLEEEGIATDAKKGWTWNPELPEQLRRDTTYGNAPLHCVRQSLKNLSETLAFTPAWTTTTLATGNDNGGGCGGGNNMERETDEEAAPIPIEEPNFELQIQGEDVSLKVHDWLLAVRWPFFRRMLEAGMEESVNKRLELPPDFPHALLLSLIQYIYGGTDYTPVPSLEDYKFILNNGALYGIVDLEGKPTDGFTPFVLRTKSTFLHNLTEANCLEQLTIRLDLGAPAAIQEAVRYLAINLDDIVGAGDLEYARIASLPNDIRLAIFDQQLSYIHESKGSKKKR